MTPHLALPAWAALTRRSSGRCRRARAARLTSRTARPVTTHSSRPGYRPLASARSAADRRQAATRLSLSQGIVVFFLLTRSILKQISPLLLLLSNFLRPAPRGTRGQLPPITNLRPTAEERVLVHTTRTCAASPAAPRITAPSGSRPPPLSRSRSRSAYPRFHYLGRPTPPHFSQCTIHVLQKFSFSE